MKKILTSGSGDTLLEKVEFWADSDTSENGTSPTVYV